MSGQKKPCCTGFPNCKHRMTGRSDFINTPISTLLRMSDDGKLARVEGVFVLCGDGDNTFHIGPFHGYHNESEDKASLINSAAEAWKGKAVKEAYENAAKIVAIACLSFNKSIVPPVPKLFSDFCQKISSEIRKLGEEK